MLTKHVTPTLFSTPLLLLLTCAPWRSCGNETTSVESVTVATDGVRYGTGQPVTIKLTNNSKTDTFVWIGPCGLTLEWNNAGAWEASPSPWSGCPMCGHTRELPEPLFLVPSSSVELQWDQSLARCEDGSIVSQDALGELRFVVRYAKDEPGCRSAADPMECWMNYNDKTWRAVYTGAFVIAAE